MKRALVWIGMLALLGALVVLTTCQPPVSPPLDGEEGDAEARATALIGAVMESQATGDYTAVEEILAQDDLQGELRQVLVEGGAFGRPAARCVEQPVRLPPFSPDNYKTGDVLVCRGSGTLTSNLMDLVLVNGYAHAGILHLEVLAHGGTECILSADVDYLAAGEDEALNYESYLDWAVKNDVITLLRPDGIPAATSGHIATVAGFRDQHTVYAFLGYPGAPVGAFQPIPRTNDDYWYCSKVPARVYDLALNGEPVEDTAFHWEPFGNGQRWMVVRESLLYKVYVAYLKLCKPWWPLWWCAYQADQALILVLRDLVTPDELRASDKLDRRWSVTPTSTDLSPKDEAKLLGWGTDLY